MCACLVQQGRTLAFASRTYNSAQLNYSTTEKECLAVVWALKYFHCYVHGATLNVYTDHAALKSILATKDPKGRIARWIVEIWCYDFTLFHRKGSEHMDADALSRIRVTNSSGEYAGNVDEDEMETSQVFQQSHDTNYEETMSPADLLKQGQQEEEKIKELLGQGSKLKLPFLIKDGILCHVKKNKSPVLVIPRTMVPKFLDAIHKDVTCGHAGRDKTLERAQSNGWWWNMNNDVIEFVKKCRSCSLFKTPTHKYKKLTSVEVGYPMEKWAADIAVLPESTSGKRYLLVLMDYFTKWTVTAALTSFDTKSVADVLIYSVILIFGKPATWITDNGKNFISEAMKTVCERLGINKVETSVEHPQSDGLIERMNRTIKTALSLYCENQPAAWDNYLPFITFSINTSVQKSTGFTPFQAMFGRQAILPSLSDLPNISQRGYQAEEWIAYLNHYLPILHKDIKLNIQRSQANQQKYYNRNRKEKESFVAGDKVIKIKMKDHWKFGEPKFSGPWKVIKSTSKNNDAFLLELLDNSKAKRNIIKTTTANIKDLYKI